MKIKNLEMDDLEEAAGLFSAAYSRQRQFAPALDETNGGKEQILPKLKGCLEKHQGVAVFDGGRMTGYMTGFYIPRLLGVHLGALSPEWAHGAVPEKSFENYRRMYQVMGQKWVEDGCLTHAINFMDHERNALEAFCWNGFGYVCIDAVRSIGPIGGQKPHGIRIEAFQPSRMSDFLPMVEAHYHHLACSPIFKPYEDKETEETLAEMLKQPGNQVWMAYRGEEALGYMKVAPEEEGAAWMVGGEKKFAVNGAFVKTTVRGSGVARLLLDEIMDWAAVEGFQRCSVDFEMNNLEASGFWTRHFTPVCRSMVRRLDQNCRNLV